jgi:hypothetical protein
MDTEFDAVPELVPDRNRHTRLASEMHCTIAVTGSSQADIPYTSQPVAFTSKTSRLVDSTRFTACFLVSRASYGEADRGRC